MKKILYIVSVFLGVQCAQGKWFEKKTKICNNTGSVLGSVFINNKPADDLNYGECVTVKENAQKSIAFKARSRGGSMAIQCAWQASQAPSKVDLTSDDVEMSSLGCRLY